MYELITSQALVFSRTTEFILAKSTVYSSPPPPQTFSSLNLEATFVSFVAKVTNEIESLRCANSSNTTASNTNKTTISHYDGIIANLLAKLQYLSSVFDTIRVSRKRDSLSILDSPFSSTNSELQFHKKKNRGAKIVTKLLDFRSSSLLMTDDEKREIQSFDAFGFGDGLFRAALDDVLEAKEGFEDDDEEEEEKDGSHHPPSPLPPPSSTQQHQKYNNDNDITNTNFYNEDDEFVANMATEHALLTASLKGDLDEIRNVEQKMMELTSLLSTFTNLITEQHSQIDDLHSTTVKSRVYLESGNDHLLKAKDRSEASKYWVAYLIYLFGFILLFLNLFMP